MAKLKSNIIYNFAYQILILILPLITAPYLARIIGAEGVGVYSYSFSIATYFVYFVMLGLNTYGNRAIASCQDSRKDVTKTFWSIYAMQCGCFLVFGGLYFAYSAIFAGGSYIALFQGLYVLSALFDINWFFFGMEQFRLTVIRNTIVKVCTAVAIFLFVKTASDTSLYVLIMAFGFLTSQIMLWPFLRRFVDFYKPNLGDVLIHLKPNLVLFVPVIAVSIYNILSKIILGSIAGAEEVGYFESAVQLVGVPIALVSAVGAVMLPRTSALLAKKEAERSNAYLIKTLVYVMGFTFLAGFGMPMVAIPFTELFYGPGFTKTAYILIILSITVPILGFGNVVRTQYLIPAGCDYVFLWSAVCGAIVNVVVNIFLIPLFGAVAAAIASVCAEIAVFSYQIYNVRDAIPLKRYFWLITPFFFAGLVMCAVLLAVPSVENMVLDVVFRVCLGVLVYSATLALVKFLKRRIKQKPNG